MKVISFQLTAPSEQPSCQHTQLAVVPADDCTCAFLVFCSSAFGLVWINNYLHTISVSVVLDVSAIADTGLLMMSVLDIVSTLS